MKALDIKALEKTYAGGVQALKGIDLEVEQVTFLRCLAQTEQVNQPLLVLFVRS